VWWIKEAAKTMQMEATAYCGCKKCCGRAGQKTKSGTIPQQGRTVAVPPTIPLGTRMAINGQGNYIAEDHGSAIKGNKIDIFFNNHQDAINFGRKIVNVTFLG
jgi:3D (Asp-Asp-Asp) domain-containing protein